MFLSETWRLEWLAYLTLTYLRILLKVTQCQIKLRGRLDCYYMCLPISVNSNICSNSTPILFVYESNLGTILISTLCTLKRWVTLHLTFHGHSTVHSYSPLPFLLLFGGSVRPNPASLWLIEAFKVLIWVKIKSIGVVGLPYTIYFVC